MERRKPYLEIRSQGAKRGRSGFSGPDTYIAVQIVPEGVEKLTALRYDSAAKRGITILQFGDGYRQHDGPRSRLGKALAAAEEFIANFDPDADLAERVAKRLTGARR